MAVNQLIILLTIALTIYIISLIIKNASIADIFWGIYFVVLTDVAIFSMTSLNPYKLLLGLLVNIWGLRLAIHIFLRFIKSKKEDRRYAEFRLKWGKNFNIRSLFQNFLLQSLLAYLIVLPLLITINSNFNSEFSVSLIWVGFILWLVGFVIESVADFQLNDFLSNNKDKSKIMDSGLWKYSRHPNYFGEILLWWAAWLICLGIGVGLWTIFGPIIITVLILFVSGVPLAEKRLKNNEKYREYIRVTSKLILLPRKKDQRI